LLVRCEMKKNFVVVVLVMVIGLLVWSDVDVRRGSGEWCVYWRVNVKICNVDVEDVRKEVERKMEVDEYREYLNELRGEGT
jgi:hypothetical protein